MRSRWLVNLVLATLVVLLLVLVYFTRGGHKAGAVALTPLAATVIHRIQVERPKQAAIVLEQTAGIWRLNAPIPARANRFNVDSLLGIVTTTDAQPVVAAGEASRYGLDKPVIHLRFDDEQIIVGALHPLNPQHYVGYRDAVFLLPSGILSAAFFGFERFIDTALLEPGQTLTTMRLPGLTLVRRDGGWRRDSADKNRSRDVSIDRLNEFIAGWENARALSVERRSAKPPLAQVKLEFENDGKPRTLIVDVLAYAPEFILARRDEGLEYHFPEAVGKRLLELKQEP